MKHDGFVGFLNLFDGASSLVVLDITCFFILIFTLLSPLSSSRCS